jgi:fructoselysine-6-P-deglycase FrlB-like protein
MVDRAAALLEDVLGEPDAVTALLDDYGGRGGPLGVLPRSAGRSRIVLTGLGSSLYAALDAATMLRAAGVAAWAEPASTATPTPAGRNTILFAISASGRTPEVVAAIGRHHGAGLVVGVTNRLDEPVATEADVVLPLFAGVEASGVSCRTFRATTAVLSLAAGRLVSGLPSVEGLRPAVEGLAGLLAGRAGWLGRAADLFDGANSIGVVGGAAHLGLAEQAALMVREGPRLPAAAHDAGEWLHTAIYTALPGYRALLLGGTAYDETLSRVIAGRGGQMAVIGAGVPGAALTIPLPAGDGPGNGLVASAIGDLLAAELWTRVSALNASDLAQETQA